MLPAVSVAAEIEAAQDLESVKKSVREFGIQFGFDRFLFFTVSGKQRNVESQIIWSEGDWLGNGLPIDEANYLNHCPISRHVFAVSQPFFWTKLASGQGDYRLVRRPIGDGIHGLQIPFFGPNGLYGAASFGGLAIDSSAQSCLSATLVAQSAFFALRRLHFLEFPEKLGALSSREREVLQWVMAGRTQSMIADILRLSERTVENHLRKIRQKLQAHTTAEAVRIAIQNEEFDNLNG